MTTQRFITNKTQQAFLLLPGEKAGMRAVVEHSVAHDATKPFGGDTEERVALELLRFTLYRTFSANRFTAPAIRSSMSDPQRLAGKP